MQQKTNVTLSIKSTIILCMGCIFLAAAAFAVTYLPLRFSPSVLKGMKIMNNAPVVAEVFGGPVQQSLLARGNLHYYLGGSGNGYIWSPIYGPKIHGEAYFYVCKPVDGDWALKGVSLHVNKEMILIWYASKADLGFQYVPTAQAKSSTPVPHPTATPTRYIP